MRSAGRVVGSWKNELCEEKQIENQSDTFLAGHAGLNRCTRKQGPISAVENSV